MVKPSISYKVLTIIVITIILLLGMFREKIIIFLNNLLQIQIDESTIPWLVSFIESYGSGKSLTKWLSHYLIFYALYLSCHFLLINLLFRNIPVVKRWVNWALIILLSFLISGKVIFGVLNVTILEEYFSFAFHKLVALPFLLLAIEGGRNIYEMLDENA